MLTAVTWLSFAFVLGLLVRLAGLPPLVGYLTAGFALSAFGHTGNSILEQVAHAGVLVLLFSVGLKLRMKSLVRPEVLAGSVLHMLVLGVLLGSLLYVAVGMAPGTALFMAAALAFSSTVVAAKILETKRELRAFHGRVAIGILIMQDLAAVAILSVAAGTAPSPWAFLLIGLVFLRPVLHRLLELSGHEDLLILYGLLLALVLGGAGFEYFGMSSELGALLVGAVLADHKRASELAHSIWGLKEVLLVGFFLQIGLAGVPSLETFGYAVLLVALLPVKAALFFAILVAFRLRARSAFLASLTLATYSEFGLIIAAVGVQSGWLGADWLLLLAVAVALSFAVAAPMNRYAHQIYPTWEPFLRRFESKRRHPDDQPLILGNSHIVVFGMGRVGTGAYDFLSQRQHRVVGLDSDPAKVAHQRQAGRRVMFADAEDPGLWEHLDLKGVKAILLAIPDLEAKTITAKKLRQMGYAGVLSATAVFPEEVAMLQKAGVNKVYNYFEGVGVGFAEYLLEDLQQAAG